MLLDSNIIIYAATPEHQALRRFIAEVVPKVSVVSKVEALGYHRLREEERLTLEEFFSAAEVLSLSDAVVQEAIRLRQVRRIKLGDALIAGTALAHGLRLVTHNTEDFEWVEGLELHDPLAEP